MDRIREYDVVRVVQLLTSDRSFSGTASCRRPPQLGDVATVCHAYAPDDAGAALAVEMVNSEGMTVWLADFDPVELELIKRPKAP